MDSHTNEKLLERIEQLERRWQSAKRAALCACALAMLAFVGWAPLDEGPDFTDPDNLKNALPKESSEAPADTGQADRANDSSPRPPLIKGATERLVIGEEGGFSLVLEGGPDAARIILRDREKQARSLLELTDLGVISRLVDQRGAPRFDLLVTDRQIGGIGKNEARLKVSDAVGNDAVLLVATDGTQGIIVVDPNGRNKLMLTGPSASRADNETEGKED